MILKFKVNIEANVSNCWKRKIFETLGVAIIKSCFGIDVGYFLMNDPQVAANNGYRCRLQLYFFNELLW